MASRIYDYIEGFFTVFKKYDYRDSPIQYESNNCFKYFFKVKKDNSLPMLNAYLVPAFLYKEKYFKSTNVPVQIASGGPTSLSETTLLSAIGKVSTYSHRFHHLIKLKTKKEEVYYGTNGIILDSNFNILIMLVLRTIPGEILDAICYINPKVFLNEKGTVEKIIIKKILPTISISRISVDSGHLGPVTFVFKDVTREYISIPMEPRKEFCDAYANNFIHNLESEVVNYLEDHFDES